MTTFTLSLYCIWNNHFDSHKVNFEYCLLSSTMPVHINYFNISTCIGLETLSMSHLSSWQVILPVPLLLGLVG